MLSNCVAGETSWESLGQQRHQPVNPKENQPWIFIGRTVAEAGAPLLWPPDVKSPLIRKDPGAGQDWKQEEKETTEDETAGWHHWLNGREFEWTPGVGERQWGLACCDSWGHKELHTTERLNWIELNLNSGRWWRTGKPSVLQSMESQSQTQLNDWTSPPSTTTYRS